MTKPFSVEEMLLRIDAVLRRTQGVVDEGPCSRSGTSSSTRRATRSGAPGRPIELTPTEFRLLHYLMVNAGQVVSKTQIRERVWESSVDGRVNMVEVYISYLRRKLDALGPSMIRTVRGLGYCLRDAEPARNARRGGRRVTLRVRLLLLVVSTVAAGLVISDVVTYNALRSFLLTTGGPAARGRPRIRSDEPCSRRRDSAPRCRRHLRPTELGATTTAPPGSGSGTSERGRTPREVRGRVPERGGLFAGTARPGSARPGRHLRPAPERAGQGRGPRVLQLRGPRHRPRRSCRRACPAPGCPSVPTLLHRLGVGQRRACPTERSRSR